MWAVMILVYRGYAPTDCASRRQSASGLNRQATRQRTPHLASSPARRLLTIPLSGADFTALASSSTHFNELLAEVMEQRLSGRDVAG